MMPMPMMPGAAMTGTGTAAGGVSPSSLQAVGRIRNVFPETWLWSNATTGYYVNMILAFRKLCTRLLRRGNYLISKNSTPYVPALSPERHVPFVVLKFIRI